MVNEVIKDGHLKGETRPKSNTKQSTRTDIAKYMTPFMAETGGYSQRSSTSRSFVAEKSNSNDSRNN